MANITHKGNPIHTNGELPAVGSKAPAFTLVDAGLAEKSLSDFQGKKKILTINPSYDTGICQKAGRAFNEKASGRANTVVLLISKDLPFAIKRFCEADGLTNVVPLSAFRSTFAKDYGAEIVDGVLQGLSARAVIVLDENDRVVYSELVPEIAQEPAYDRAIAALG
jgi:thioredoxin-dependent peroxiredoxin